MLTSLAPAEKKNNSKSANSNNTTTQRKVLPSVVKPMQLKGAEEESIQGKFKSGNNEPAVQLVEEEEPLQGKFEAGNQPTQLVEEEEPLQGKFESTNQPAQLAEEEEPLQGKFESTNQPAQLAEEEEPLQGKFESTNQPAQLAEEEEPLQGKFESGERKSSPNWAFQLKSNIGNSTNSATTQKSAPTANNTGLPDSLKSGVEQLSGISMDDVKVNYNSAKPAQLHAHAYAQGKDIHVAPGQEKHLPHEAWHVAQQKQGRVQATKQLKGKVPVNDDKGLENEADVMGAKAVAQGKLIKIANPVQRKKVNKATNFSPVSQRVVIQRKPTDIVGMIENAKKLVSENIFTSDLGTDSLGTKALEKGVPVVDGLAAGAGAANKIVSGAANVVGSLGDAASSAVGGAAAAAQGIVEAVGIAIRIVTSTISSVSSMDKTFKGDEKKFTGGGKAAMQLGELLRQGAKAANAVLSNVNGVSGAIMSMLPGLGLAIAGCDLLVNAYTAYNASTAQEEMGDVADLYRNDLAAILGATPESFGKLFQNEKRGKFFNRETYLRIKPGASASLEEAKNGDPDAKLAFLRSNSIPPETDFDQLYKAIRYYELGSKMQEINQKRKIQGMRNMFTDLVQIGAEIAKMFPADGGITAGVLTGVAGGAKAAQAAGKFLQGQARNVGLGDSNRSEDSKHLEYVTHTKSIYQFIAGIDNSEGAENESQLIKAEQFISATGADLGSVFSLTDKPQAEFLVKAMKKGR